MTEDLGYLYSDRFRALTAKEVGVNSSVKILKVQRYCNTRSNYFLTQNGAGILRPPE